MDAISVVFAIVAVVLLVTGRILPDKTWEEIKQDKGKRQEEKKRRKHRNKP